MKQYIGRTMFRVLCVFIMSYAGYMYPILTAICSAKDNHPACESHIREAWGYVPKFNLFIDTSIMPTLYIKIGNDQHPITQDTPAFMMASGERLLVDDYITQLWISGKEFPTDPSDVEFYLISPNKVIRSQLFQNKKGQIAIGPKAVKKDFLWVPEPYLPFQGQHAGFMNVVRNNDLQELVELLQGNPFEAKDAKFRQPIYGGWTAYHELAYQKNNLAMRMYILPPIGEEKDSPLLKDAYGQTPKDIADDPRVLAFKQLLPSKNKEQALFEQIQQASSHLEAQKKTKMTIKNNTGDLVDIALKRLPSGDIIKKQIANEAELMKSGSWDILAFKQSADAAKPFTYISVNPYRSSYIEVMTTSERRGRHIQVFSSPQKNEELKAAWIRVPYDVVDDKPFGDIISKKLIGRLIRGDDVEERVKFKEKRDVGSYDVYVFNVETPDNKQTTDVIISTAPIPWLHYAIWHGNITWVKALIEYGWDLGQKDINGFTPLQLAKFAKIFFERQGNQAKIKQLDEIIIYLSSLVQLN